MKPRRKAALRIGDLDTLPEIYREMTLLYRDAMHGRIEAEAYTKLAYVLECASRTLQALEKTKPAIHDARKVLAIWESMKQKSAPQQTPAQKSDTSQL